MKNIINKIEELDWNVNEYDGSLELSRYSSAGQDFSINVSIGECKNDFLSNLYEVYVDFDVSYETYLWLDNTGHGINGAPYDMIDVYKDMEECQESILELYDELIK